MQLERTNDKQDTEQSGEQSTTSTDDRFTILSNSRRRHAIKYLASSDEPAVRLRDMAEQIAAWENDLSVYEVNYKQRKRVYTSLYQTHLPRMNRVDIVEYDQSSGMIWPTDGVTELYPYLEPTSPPVFDWHQVGIVVSGLCFFLVTVAFLELIPDGGWDGYGIAFLISMLFLTVTAGQYLDS
ncbi:DUF7344 domain-containing protein [Natrarchaeobaculum sulfurireducens]|uniref:DUF7344 domain-containing protein n=1 Tax=Natrarchaeobaculum sulfurireducens TaxID=2044521 RepID=A0A346PA03_9EURY|nr:hypothetical protein [Natrarchaeobaculum sulfurireducens]AXR76348.1 hypothetical protein AArc1_5147 [Natrarchaeobaculum sulfurireducens]